MLNVNLNQEKGIAVITPDGKLSKEDFVSAAEIIDPYIEKTGKLNGVIIYVKTFPGWESFAALLKHLQFIKAHHKKVSCVAFVTDSSIGGFAEHFASHFTSAEIKHFAFNEFSEAEKWIADKR